MATEPKPPFGVLDLPRDRQTVDGLLTIQGWALSRRNDPVDIYVRLGGEATRGPLRRCVRPDVSRHYPGHADANPFPGFSAVISTVGLKNGRCPLTCEIHSGAGIEILKAVELEIRNTRHSGFFRRTTTDDSNERRQRKLSALRHLLACPRCANRVQVSPASFVECATCGQVGVVVEGVPVFGMDEAEVPSPGAPIIDNTSAYPYPEVVLEQLEAVHRTRGWALDLGAGSRLYGADRLVQLEIAAYPFTDVVSRTERLPFLDGSFDLVVSLSAFEHIPHPWIAAREVQRVLKDGGHVHVETAFLQPLHDYPSHYFNMSDQGLKEIFPEIDITLLKPLQNQLPWFSLRWIVDSLLRGVPADKHDAVASMSLEQISVELNKYASYLPSAIDGIELPEQLARELAAGFALIGKRRSRKGGRG